MAGRNQKNIPLKFRNCPNCFFRRGISVKLERAKGAVRMYECPTCGLTIEGNMIKRFHGPFTMTEKDKEACRNAQRKKRGASG